MKFFYFVGTLNPNTEIEYWIERLIQYNNIFSDENFIHYAKNSSIEICLGCTSCFYHGTCPYDSKDDITLIKEHMLNSDVIIWITPVYLSNVSGIMKNFIDRICEWLHILRLSGKLGVIITFSEGSGYNTAGTYLQTILNSMGCKVIGKYDFIQSQNTKQKFNIISKIQSRIEKAITSNERFLSSETMEETYTYLKSYYKVPSPIPNYEINYWNTNPIGSFNSYQDYLNYISINI